VEIEKLEISLVPRWDGSLNVTIGKPEFTQKRDLSHRSQKHEQVVMT